MVILSAPCSHIYGRSIPQDISVGILFYLQQFCKGCLSSCHSPTDSPLFNNSWHCSSAEVNRLYSPVTSPVHLLFLQMKLYWNTAQAHWFTYCLYLLHSITAELSSGNRDFMTLKAWNICYLALYRKSLPIPILVKLFFIWLLQNLLPLKWRHLFLHCLMFFFFLWINLSKLHHLL